MKFEKRGNEYGIDIYHSRNLLMKFEIAVANAYCDIYHSRNLLMKFEYKLLKELPESTTVEIY